ncbi:MAG: hypothetical protein HKN87_23195 [Saprospiraceae bacterium]|nr:hypothetical protein [Saprospiraceae bacterium]
MDDVWNRIRSLFKQDRSSLYICFTIAFVAWFLTKMGKDYIYEQSYPIRYILDGDKTFTSSPPTILHSEVRAKGWAFLKMAISSADDSVYIDARTTQNGQLNTRLLLANNLRKFSHDELNVTMVNPEVISYQLASKAKKRVPVHMGGDLSLANQYQLRSDIQFSPDTISIFGATEAIDTISYVSTVPIEEIALTKDLRRSINLQVPPNGVTLERSVVDVHIPVEQITEKELPVSIQLADSLVGKVQIFPDQALVKCVVGLSKFDEITKDAFTLVAFPSSRVGAKTLLVKVEKYPPFAQSISFTPKEVEFFTINP